MYGLTSASMIVVIARSYSRYSGNTSHDSETNASGMSALSCSPTRRSCSGLAYECSRQTPMQSTPQRRNVPTAAATSSSVERRDLAALVIDAAAHLDHTLERDDPLGLDPEVRVAVAVGNRLARDLQHVPEAAGDDQPQASEATLEHGVGRRRRAVHDGRDLVQGEPALRRDLAHPVHEPGRGVVGGGRRLGHDRRARPLVDGDDVGERAARVDRDAVQATPARSAGGWRSGSAAPA